MSFRERMKVNPSAGQDKVLIELQRRGLLSRMDNPDTVLVFYDSKPTECVVVRGERFTREMARECDGFTVPDYPFLDDGFVGYLDGPPHLKRGPKNRDDAINQKLLDCGIDFKRFPYRPPLSNKHCKEIVDEIESRVHV